MFIEWPAVLFADTKIVSWPLFPGFVLVTTWVRVTRKSAPTWPLSWKNIILTPGSAEQDMSMNVMTLKKFTSSLSAWQVSWVHSGFLVQFLSHSGFVLSAIWSRSHICGVDAATEKVDYRIIIILIQRLYTMSHYSSLFIIQYYWNAQLGSRL